MKASLVVPIMAVSTVGFVVSTAGGTHAAATTTSAHVSPSGAAARCTDACPVAGQASSTQAASSTTAIWVANSAPIGNNTSCTQPKYQTISAALTAAASGATIKVCSGTYPEQLAITKAVTLTALGTVVEQGPATVNSSLSLTPCDADGGSGTHNNDLVDICGAVTVTITGFTFQGGWPSNVCYGQLYGVAVLGHATLIMSGSTVQNVGGDPLSDGCQGGVGIQVGLATSGTTADFGKANLTNVTVKAYQKNGITIDGKGSSAALASVTVSGAGPTTAIAQNGIQVSDFATATLNQALVSGDECNVNVCGSDYLTQTQSCGLLLFDAGTTTVSHSNVNTSDIGVCNVEDVAWAFYTPANPFVAIPETFTSMTLANRYDNAVFDGGKSSLQSSVLRGGLNGVLAAQYNGQATATVVSMTKDNISAATSAAVIARSDQHAGNRHVSLTVTNSAIFRGGVVNQGVSFASSTVNATQDWWGNASGPSSWGFGSGSPVTADVNFFPWATNSAITTFEPCTSGLNSTTTSSLVVLCATAGTGNAFLANNGSGKVLLIGNSGNDQLLGSATGKTWIIGGVGGSNTINGNGGTGFIQERGNPNDTLVATSGYTVAPK